MLTIVVWRPHDTDDNQAVRELYRDGEIEDAYYHTHNDRDFPYGVEVVEKDDQILYFNPALHNL